MRAALKPVKPVVPLDCLEVAGFIGNFFRESEDLREDHDLEGPTSRQNNVDPTIPG